MGEILLKEQSGFERTESYVAYVCHFRSWTFKTYMHFRNLNMILGPGLLGTKGKYDRGFNLHMLLNDVAMRRR